MTKRASLLTVCMSFLLVVGACSSDGSPVTADPGPDLSRYSSSIQGVIHQGGGPVTYGHVFIYDLAGLELYNEADIGPEGGYIAGVDSGQYLVFPVSPAGWRDPTIETDFSNYVNVESDNAYRMDIELTSVLPDGDELVFGFVTSSENGFAIVGATVSAGGRSTNTDGYGFYAMRVPSGTAAFTLTAPGFHDLHENIRDAQANGDDYFETPFFELNPKNVAGASLGGIVRDIADGTGLGGARITLTVPADPLFGPIRFLTNLGGEYRFYNLIEGVYRLHFERPGYQSGYRDGLVLKDKDDAIINMFMMRDTSGRATIMGYVNNASMPLPVSSARVSASNPLLGSYTDTTDPTGYYSLEEVIPADYTITVVGPSGAVSFYESASTFHTIVPGDNRIDFNLPFINEGVLWGNVDVAGAMGWPPTGVDVTAEKVGGPLSGVKWRTTTDGRGIFVFNGLPAGSYLVRGRAEYSSTEIFMGTLSNVVVSAGTTTVVDLTLAL